MSSTFGWSTANMQKIIQSQLELSSYTATKMYSFFKTLGMIKNIGPGIRKHETTKLEKMEKGKILAHRSSLPTNSPRFTELETELMVLGAKVVVRKQDLDGWRSNNLIGVDIMDVINEQIKAFLVQIDQFLNHGDEMKDPYTDDPKANLGVFKGMFNGGTAFGGGDGGDNGVGSAGDYMSTKSKGIKNLKNAGFESKDGYFMFSDTDTYHDAQEGVHQKNSYTFTNERRAIEADKDIKSWVDSPNMQNADGDHQILLTNPFRNPGPNQQKAGLAYKLIQGYPLEVFPLFNGGVTSNLTYEWGILWSGALEIQNQEAIQVTGALNFAT